MARTAVEEGDGAPSFRPLWRLMPYLWPKDRPDLRARVLVSIVFLVLATGFTSVSPLIFGWAVDRLRPTPANIAIGSVLSLIAAYVMSRILMQAFAQLRDGIFAKVQYHAMREVAVETFAHVHTLSLRFHLERKTGGLSRVIERGIKGIDTLLSFALFSIFPTILLLAFYSAILLVDLNVWVAISTVVMVIAYVWFTFCDHPLAHPVPPRDEPVGHRRQHQGGGQSAQFRDRQIFQQRNARDRGASTSRWRNSPAPRSSRRFRCPISTPARPRSWRRAWAR